MLLCFAPLDSKTRFLSVVRRKTSQGCRVSYQMRAVPHGTRRLCCRCLFFDRSNGSILRRRDTFGHLLVIAVAIFMGGCQHEKTDKEKSDAAKVLRAEEAIKTARHAKSETEKWAAYWPIVRAETPTSAVRQSDSGNPITITISLDESPHEWSEVKAVRTKSGEPSTIDIELASAVQSIPWSPAKDLAVLRALGTKQDGPHGLLELRFDTPSDASPQTRGLRFRLLNGVDQ